MFVTNGLVTRSYVLGNGDRVVHMLTPDNGRISVMVKRTGKATDQTAALTQLFTWGNYELYPKGEMYWLRRGSILMPFYELTADLSAMALGAYLCDVASDISREGVPAEELLHILLNALYLLQQGKKNHAIIKGAFEFRVLALGGYAPNLEQCCVCGTEELKESYLDVMNGQLICADCQNSLNRQRLLNEERRLEILGERRIICPMTPSALAAVRYVLDAPEKKIYAFDLKDEEELKTFAKAAETYLLHHLERDFETLTFYRSVQM